MTNARSMIGRLLRSEVKGAAAGSGGGQAKVDDERDFFSRYEKTGGAWVGGGGG